RILIAADSPPSQSEVARLLNQLDADTRAERVAAERRLLELGPDVLPLLPPPELLRSAAVRDAVGKIRVELEQRKARESVLPSRVTLHGKQPVARALDEIARQTGNRVETASLPAAWLDRAVELDFDAVPFWQAIDGIAQQM